MWGRGGARFPIWGIVSSRLESYGSRKTKCVGHPGAFTATCVTAPMRWLFVFVPQCGFGILSTAGGASVVTEVS